MSTTFTIGSLVQVDDHATFRSHVQLDSFDTPKLNQELVNSYLFSNALPAGSQYNQSNYISPVGVLEKLEQSFNSERLSNTFSLVATYGHGKSHLALALTNYFSKPYEAPETKTLLSKLGNALPPARAVRYTEFKKSRGEFLVLRLKGDVLTSLQQQVLNSLEHALGEHNATKSAKLPFWFTEAERIINQFSLAEEEQANAYMQAADWPYDVSLLRQHLGERKEAIYDVCIKLIQHVKGVRPDLTGEVSLSQVILWVTEKFCGRDKPLGGLLILFDEFTLYVQRHAKKNATGELQDLLNGVDKCRGNAVFLAFSQVDPTQVANNLSTNNTVASGLKKELGRIEVKLALYSLMESVIEAYLIQNKNNWPLFLQDHKVKGPLFQASDIVTTHFRKRYRDTLNWSGQDVQERLAKGCFPLHPITTYLLCNLGLQSSADDANNPRTILGFILRELEARQDQPALLNDLPNWILPIGLIDYFEGLISGDVYKQYEAARRTLKAHYSSAEEDTTEAPEDETFRSTTEAEAVLKGLLLQELAEVPASQRDQIDFLAHTTGIPHQKIASLLRQLSTGNIIRPDTVLKRYSFWPASIRPEVLERIIQQKLATFNWAEHSLKDFNNILGKTVTNFGKINVQVKWGHAEDWAAQEYAVPISKLTVEWLRTIAQQLIYDGRQGLQEVSRSVVLWMVNTEETEDHELRKTIHQIFQEAFVEQAEHPPVAIAVTPQRKTPHLLEAYRRLWALEQFSQKERADAGQEIFDKELSQANNSLGHIFNNTIRLNDRVAETVLRPAETYMVPTAYLSEIRRHKEVGLRQLLLQLYETAFMYAPPKFFTQYTVGRHHKLKTATVTACEYLMTNKTKDLEVIANNSSNKPLDDLCDILIKEWHLLTVDYHIRAKPETHRVLAAWRHIDETIKPGKTEYQLRKVLFALLNPPFGYDYNTALLLFSAWFGYNQRDLQVMFRGQKVNVAALVQEVKNGPKGFFEAISTNKVVSIQRRTMPNVVELKRDIDDLATQKYSQETAQEQIGLWQERAEDTRYNEDLRQQMKQFVKQLQADLTLAEKYDAQAKKIRTAVEQTAQPSQLVAQLTALSQLPPLGNVEAQETSPAKLKTEIEARFTAVVEAFCRENEDPPQLTAVDLYRERLQIEKKAVAKANLPTLANRFDEALQQLAQREENLRQAAQQQQQHQDWQTTLDSIDLKGRLKHLLHSHTTLDNLANLPDDLEVLRQTRLAQVKEAIQSIYNQVNQHRQTLETVSQSSAVSEVRDRLISLQMICADTAVADEIDQLLSQADQRRQELAEQEKKIGEWRTSIKSITPRQSNLRQLQEGQRQLQALTDLPPDVEHLRDQKLHEIEAEIHTIQQQITDAQTRIEDVTSRAALDQYRDHLSQLKQRCIETSATNKLEECAQQVDNLRRFFSALEDERNVRIESPVTIRAQNKRLDELQTAYALSEPQLHVLAETKAKLVTAVAEQRQKARQWLIKQQDSAQEAANSTQLIELINRLDTPPSTIQFLPIAEQQTVTALRQQIQKRIDDDTVTAIVTRFRQISDPELQSRCLQQLQDIWADNR
jgi:hypothetical protein